MKKLMFYLSLLILFASAACSASSSEKSGEQKDSLDSAFKAKTDSIMFLIRAIAEEDHPESTNENVPLKSSGIIGCPPITLVFINGERCRDFAYEHSKIFNVKEFTIEKLKAFLKKRNYIFDDVKILKDDESLEKYRKGGYVASGAEQWIETVYEIKAHPINQKGEIFEIVAHMPSFPNGYDARTLFIAENVRHPKEMLQEGIYGMVLVDCVIGKDGAVEEPKVIDYRLKDQSGKPCNDPTIKKLCDKEALRVVKKMPRWEPGRRENDDFVRVRKHITVFFLEKIPPRLLKNKE